MTYVAIASLICYTCVEYLLYRYSCNEGISWNDFTFTTTPTVIWGVIPEPGETTTEVTSVYHRYGVKLFECLFCRLFGSENRQAQHFVNLEWAIISINFFSVFQRNCTNDDYQDWAVSDGVCMYVQYVYDGSIIGKG